MQNYTSSDFNRIGKFIVSSINLKSSDPKLRDPIQAIFAQVIPLHIESPLFNTDCIVVGTSDLFEELPEGHKIPYYVMSISEFYDSAGRTKYFVTAKKQKEDGTGSVLWNP